MMEELHKAKSQQNHNKTVRKHIAHVHLLCELILENDSDAPESVQQSKISSQEMKAMMGGQPSLEHQKSKQKDHSIQSNISHHQANGDSIFDF